MIVLKLFLIKMRTGKVKFFIESKGFGFITDDQTGVDIFVHITGLSSQTLKEGNKVSYVEEDGKKGKVATNVTVVE